MARKTRLTPYGEQIFEAFELDESGYRFTPSMATKDGFASDVPLFLSDHDEEREPPDTGKVWYRAAISSRNLRTSILVVTAAAIVFAILAVGTPVALFANATASLVGISAPQSGTGESTPAVQSSSSAQASPAARDAPTHAEIVAAFNTAHQSQTEIRQPPAEASLKQFQAWATEQDARAQVQKQR
jgi:hypothetical protein